MAGRLLGACACVCVCVLPQGFSKGITRPKVNMKKKRPSLTGGQAVNAVGGKVIQMLYLGTTIKLLPGFELE